MLEYFNVCLLDFCITQILTYAIIIIECISWLIKVTDSNDVRWKPETGLCHLMFTQDRQRYRRYTEARSGKHWCRGKTIIITYSECVSIV